MRIQLTICSLFIINLALAAEFEEKLQFSDKVVNDAFIQELSNQNIPHRLDSEGAVWYPYERRKKVGTIERNIIRQYHPGNAVGSKDPEFLAEVVSQFKENKITYRTIELSNETKIAWEESENDKARAILREVEHSFSRKRFEEFVRQRQKKKNAL